MIQFHFVSAWDSPDKNVLLLCGHIGIINLKLGNTKICERSILWQQNQQICMQE